jgi:hypothetical protein
MVLGFREKREGKREKEEMKGGVEWGLGFKGKIKKIKIVNIISKGEYRDANGQTHIATCNSTKLASIKLDYVPLNSSMYFMSVHEILTSRLRIEYFDHNASHVICTKRLPPRILIRWHPFAVVEQINVAHLSTWYEYLFILYLSSYHKNVPH